MMRHRFVAALGAVAFCAATSAPIEARAQFGGYGGNVLGGVIGGVIAGSIIANAGPRVVYYRRPRVVYARPRVVYARPRLAYARPAPRHAASPVAPRAATINAASDPFATAKPSGVIPVANKP